MKKRLSATKCPHCGKSFLTTRFEFHLQTVHPSPPTDPTRHVQELVGDSTIRSLHRSARVGEERILRWSTFTKFEWFEVEVRRLLRLYTDQAPRADLTEAQVMCATIRDSLDAGSFLVMPKPRTTRGAEPTRGMIICSGGVPGLGKRS